MLHLYNSSFLLVYFIVFFVELLPAKQALNPANLRRLHRAAFSQQLLKCWRIEHVSCQDLGI